mgnify:CR=1 FL=1
MDEENRYGHWDISAVGEFDPADYFGFIYEIEQKSTGKAYIGKKHFRFKRKKTKSNKSRTKDSDWKDYTSSSELVQDLIEEFGIDDFDFRILLLCTGKCMLGYEEESMQRARDVLRARLPNGELKYFNRTIGYKNFAGLEKQTEEAKRKRSEAQKGIPRGPLSEETKAKMSAVRKGRKLTPEHCAAISAGKMGHAVSVETREKLSESHKGHKHSPETRAKMSESQKAIGNAPPVNWDNRNRKSILDC